MLLFGAAIYRGNVELIAGYDPNKVTNKADLAKWVGSNLIFIGLWTLIFPILNYFIQTPMIGLWILGFTIICVRTVIGCKKYE